MAGFSSAQAALRIRRLQLFCKQNGLDGVLMVPGVDGLWGRSNHVVGWLFEGRSNRDTIDVNKLKDQLDDAVALVTPSEVALYVPTPELHEQLQELLLPHVASLRMFGPTSAEAADPDALEENKLASFVHMLRACKRLGIPCGLATPQPSDTTTGSSANGGAPHASLPELSAGQLVELEKWPLLQAYGLEGVGRAGFFTMNFQVFDVQAALQRLYGELDGRSLAVLLAEGAPTLRQHWDEMLQALGGKAPGSRGGLSEKQVVEPLAGYFAYGLLRTAAGVEQALTMPPRAVFGPRSSDDAAASEAAPLSSCGPAPGVPPLHLVVEAADPRSPLRVARTYFLSRGAAERNVFADLDEEAEEGYSFEAALAAGGWSVQATEAVGLMRLYAALVEAARAAMGHFATVEGATALSAKAEAQEVLARRAEQLGVAGGGGGKALASRLRFALCQCDHANRVTAPAVRGSRQLKVLRLSLPQVDSRADGPLRGAPLGGLVYADTFLDLPSPPPGAAAASSTAAGGSGGTLLVLTEGVPPLLAIPAGGPEEDLAARALRSLAVVVGGSAGAQAARAMGHLAADRGRRAAAAAAADSQALAAKVRERNRGAAAAAEGDEEDGGEEEEEDAKEEKDAASDAARAAASGPQPEEALGRLLTLGGGEDAVLLTGAPSCPALSGTLYCFSAGLVFVEAASRAVWTLDLRAGGGGGGGGGLEAVTMQRLPLVAEAGKAAGSSNGDAGAASAGPSLGEAVVFRGCAPACGLPPAAHLTTNTHVALALGAMSPAARRSLITVVLPAWQQTCRQAASAAASAGSSAATYLKDMEAPNPFPPALHRAHAFAVQASSAGGASKQWSAVAADDAAVEAALEGLDAQEMHGALSGVHPHVEALLLQPPVPATAGSSSGGGIALVVGLPGADQAAVAAALASSLGGGSGSGAVAAQVALIPAAPGPLCPADFAAALAAAPQSQQGQPALVLVTSSYVGLAEQLAMLAAAALGGGRGAAAAGSGSGRWWLVSVVVCVAAEALWEEPLRAALAAGALGQLAGGYVDAVVVGGQDAAKVSALTALVSERLPGVPQVRSGRQQLLRAMEELLPPPADRLARLAAPGAAAARRWAPLAVAGGSGGGGGGGGCPGGLLGPLQATRVVLEGPLDLGKLREELRALGIPAVDAASVPPMPLADEAVHGGAVAALVCVSGCVRLLAAAAAVAGSAVSAKAVELVGSRGAALRSREWALAGARVAIGCPLLPSADDEPGGELTFVGSGAAVTEAALRQMLSRCAAPAAAIPSSSSSSALAAPAAPSSSGPVPSSAAQLSREQRSAVRYAHLFDPLPEGYCFNGTQYFDAFGDASLEHPEMDRFIAEWIAEQQAQVEVVAAAARQTAASLAVVRVEGPVRL